MARDCVACETSSGWCGERWLVLRADAESGKKHEVENGSAEFASRERWELPRLKSVWFTGVVVLKIKGVSVQSILVVEKLVEYVVAEVKTANAEIHW